MMKQKDAVFAALQSAAEQGLAGNAQVQFAVEQVKAGLMTGEIQHSAGQITDEKRAKSYAGSLVSNWRKKDDRLNNGTKYVPATRRGPIVKDDRLKKLSESLKALKAHNRTEDMQLIQKVELEIANRKSSLAAEKNQGKVQSLEEAMASLAELGVDIESESN